MFNQGKKLSNGLIDPDRLFDVMNKVKSMVTSSKIISYQEICSYIENESKYIQNQDVDIEGQQHIQDLEERKWSECVDFMRKNPKLMMQMLPDSLNDTASE